ncbi:MAG TPA: hypothetical protein VF691_09475, partial [Cytophagaceae bacterium]
MKKNLVNFICSIVLILLCRQSLWAQAGSNDPTFNPTDLGFGDGVDGKILTTAVQSDGKIWIGGQFTRYSGFTRKGIARLNSDGTLDETFDLSEVQNSTVASIVIQNDGKILIGGYFSNLEGKPIKSIVRLNTDGSIDPSFKPDLITNNGSYNGISTIEVQNDGKIIIAGRFSTIRHTEIYLTRLNANGSLDLTFNTGTGVDQTINDIAIQSDGKIIIGGAFWNYDGVPRRSIARLNSDGSLDKSFDPGSGPSDVIYDILLQNTGEILIGGKFISYNGNAINRVARLASNGNLDPSFNLGAGANDDVYTLAIGNDGKILIGGNFTKYNGVSKNRIVRLSNDGTLDNSFIPLLELDSYIQAIVFQRDGKILTVENSLRYLGNIRHHITRLSDDGSADPSFFRGTGANGGIRDIGLQGDGKLVVTGDFTRYDGVTRNGIARLNPDGALDKTFNPLTGVNDRAVAVAIQKDGKILLAGSFVQNRDSAVLGIIRLNDNGTLDLSFRPTLGKYSYIEAIALQADGKILISGSFRNQHGDFVGEVARLNIDGTFDKSFEYDPGFHSDVRKIRLAADGRILVAGFIGNRYSEGENIAKLKENGSIDQAFDPSSEYRKSGT